MMRADVPPELLLFCAARQQSHFGASKARDLHRHKADDSAADDYDGLAGEGSMQRFLDSFMYRDEAFLVDEVLRLDEGAQEIEARHALSSALELIRVHHAGAQTA